MKNIEVDSSCGLDSISHSGIIKKIDHNFYYVSIVAQSACASCHAKGACNVTDLSEEIVEVPRSENNERKVGDRVRVAMHKSLGTRAVLLGYIIPFFLVLAVLITFLSIFDNQGLAGLLSLVVLVPYYLLLHAARGRLKKTFSFTIQ